MKRASTSPRHVAMSIGMIEMKQLTGDAIGNGVCRFGQPPDICVLIESRKRLDRI